MKERQRAPTSPQTKKATPKDGLSLKLDGDPPAPLKKASLTTGHRPIKGRS